MKKTTLLITALALVFGLSQCRKQNAPTINGETIVQHITVGATCNGGNSKMSGTTAGNALKLKWDANERIRVYRMDENLPAIDLHLSEGYAGKPYGKFEGTIEGIAGVTTLSFLYFGNGALPCITSGLLDFDKDKQYMNQNGMIEKTPNLQEGEGFSIRDRLILHAKGIPFINSSVAEYSVDLEVPYAILKLDLSYFGTDAGTTVTITPCDNSSASVTGVKADSKEVYVAMPAADSREYTFSGNGKTAKVTWKLDKNTYYTRTDGNGGSTGEAIVIEPVLTVTTNNPYYLAHDCELKGVVYSDPQQTCKVGFVYSTSNDNPTVGPNDCKNYECYWTVDATPDGVEFDYAVSLDDMSIGNNYVRAYAIVNGGSNYVYGETKNIVLEATISFEDFEVQCENADVELSVMVYSTMPQHCEHGFVVSTTENPTYEQNDYLIGESDGDVDSHGTYYSGVGNNLEPGHYYVRAYAKGENGVYVYSEQKDFTVSGR